jgi:signal peptidase I
LFIVAKLAEVKGKMMENNDQKINKEKEIYYGVGSFLWEIIKVFILALIFVVPIKMFLFQPFFVQGSSMFPNFHDGEYLIIDELGYKKTEVGLAGYDILNVNPFRELKRGEPIVFRYPKNPSQYFIKRVIGLPGEKVEIKDSQVVIFNNDHPDGMVLDESNYLKADVVTAGDMVQQLSNSEYFVLGDNRTQSSDSRYWGPVPKSDIIGRVLIRAWPVSRAGIF